MDNKLTKWDLVKFYTGFIFTALLGAFIYENLFGGR